MPTYITLYRWTEQGVRNLKDAPARIDASIKAGEAKGGKIIGVYVTMGEYDLAAISEWPNDEAAAAMVLSQAAQGNVKTTTMRAFTTAEFASIVKLLA